MFLDHRNTCAPITIILYQTHNRLTPFTQASFLMVVCLASYIPCCVPKEAIYYSSLDEDHLGIVLKKELVKPLI